jgi:outer membrane protein assembly factor BamA
MPVGNRDLFVARLELGADLTKADPAQVPASLRFRAGGTDSIRGYSFQSIGTPEGAAVVPALPGHRQPRIPALVQAGLGFRRVLGRGYSVEQHQGCHDL